MVMSGSALAMRFMCFAGLLAAHATSVEPAVRQLAALESKMGTTTRQSGNQVIIKLVESKLVPTAPKAVAWSPDNKLIATAGDTLAVLVWDADRLSVLHELNQGERGGGRDHIAFSKDGRYLASGLSTINLWETGTWNLQRKLIPPHVTPGILQAIGIRSIAFSPDNSLLVVAYQGAKWIVVAFRVEDGGVAWRHVPKRSFGKPDDDTGALITAPLAFAPDGKVLVFGAADRGFTSDGDPARSSRLVILDARSGALVRSIDRIHVDSPTALAISHDGTRVATGTATGVVDQTGNIKTNRTVTIHNKDPIRVWDISTGKLVSELPVTSRVWALVISKRTEHSTYGTQGLEQCFKNWTRGQSRLAWQ